MIQFLEDKKVFHLQTENTSYIINILPSGHLGSLYYGKKVATNQDYNNFVLKHNIEVGSQVIY
ncbi:MAG: hypothetical protein AB7U52_04615, partial [Candidatus Izemoplasmatales bacterium]